MKPDLITALFQDVYNDGTATIRKTKLLWMFGRMNDTRSFWQLVLEQWGEFAPGVTLQAGFRNDIYTLSCADVQAIQGRWAD